MRSFVIVPTSVSSKENTEFPPDLGKHYHSQPTKERETENRKKKARDTYIEQIHDERVKRKTIRNK